MPTLRAIARHDGRDVVEAVLESRQARVSALNWGCALRDWRAAAAGGRAVTLGFPRFEDYLADRASFGIVAGRVANRIARGRFRLNGRTARLEVNDPPHHLHGGSAGLGRRLWRMEADAAANAVRLTCDSPHGEGGYPGAVAFEVTIRLQGARLSYDMRARPDRPTPINLAQHAYWNLDGGGDALGHRLRLAASRWTPTDAMLIPTGELRDVAGGPLDFREARAMRGPDGAPQPLDANVALDGDAAPGRGADAPAAELTGGRGDLRLRLWTDQPGLQVYNAATLGPTPPGHGGRPYGPFAGVCLEPQNFPDAINQPGFPDPVFGPERPYRQRLTLEIGPP